MFYVSILNAACSSDIKSWVTSMLFSRFGCMCMKWIVLKTSGFTHVKPHTKMRHRIWALMKSCLMLQGSQQHLFASASSSHLNGLSVPAAAIVPHLQTALQLAVMQQVLPFSLLFCMRLSFFRIYGTCLISNRFKSPRNCLLINNYLSTL